MNTPERVFSFPPSLTAQTHTLILGSMPGARSLQEAQYYAHPQNAFWPIMAEIFGFDIKADYQTRLSRLNEAGYALWDVLRSCHRPGSLDSSIQTESMVMNDFESLFHKHPGIRRVLFNGSAAEKLFRQHVWVTLNKNHPGLILHRMPSTSPAYAAMPRAEKKSVWQSIMLDEE